MFTVIEVLPNGLEYPRTTCLTENKAIVMANYLCDGQQMIVRNSKNGVVVYDNYY